MVTSEMQCGIHNMFKYFQVALWKFAEDFLNGISPVISPFIGFLCSMITMSYSNVLRYIAHNFYNFSGHELLNFNFPVFHFRHKTSVVFYC